MVCVTISRFDMAEYLNKYIILFRTLISPMAVIVLVGCWVIAFAVVGGLLCRYRNPQTTHTFILLSVFFSWLLPFSLTFLLPIDVSSSRYEACLERLASSPLGIAGKICEKSWLYVPAAYRYWSWVIVYWSTFLLSWILVPFLQGYVLGGQFTVLGKSLYSLRLNFIFYGVGLLAIGLLVAYLRLGTTITTREGIMSFLMALSNALGLLAVVLFLGHGLVKIPIRLWRSADAHRQLCKLEARALSTQEAAKDAEANLETLVQEIQGLALRTRHLPRLRPFVDQLLDLTPVPSDEELAVSRPITNRAVQDANLTQQPLTLAHLEGLSYKIREAISKRDRTAWQWRKLLESAWYWEDVIANERSDSALGWRSSVEVPIASPLRRRAYWWWRVRIRSYALCLTCFICVLLSFTVFWSEVTLPVTGEDLSLITPLMALGTGTVEILTAIFLLYMAGCTYSSFLKLRVLSFFTLVPGQHTDDKSLLFFAAYITRLTFPLGYNYVTLVDGSLHTEFARAMGRMNLVPLLGRHFNFYVPLSLSFICVTVLFRLHKKFFGAVSHEPEQADIDDGKHLIAQARRLEEREVHARIRRSSSTRPSSTSDLASKSLNLSLGEKDSRYRVLDSGSSSRASSQTASWDASRNEIVDGQDHRDNNRVGSNGEQSVVPPFTDSVNPWK